MSNVPSSDDILDQFAREYLEEIDAGRQPDWRSWASRYPELAEDIERVACDLNAHDEVAGRIVTEEPQGALPTSVNQVRQTTPTPTLRSNATAPVRRRQRPRGRWGDYEILEDIAAGGMGIVFKARQVSLDRLVALKVIQSGPVASPDDLQRFQIEVEAAARLTHPNIVAIHEVGEWDGLPYFSMQLLDGGSLTDKLLGLHEQPRQAAALLAKVARAVHFAHERGILHRDLKPGNILLDERGEPYVADFGLAKRLEVDSQLTQPGMIVGTPSYMAPEQAAGGKIGPAADTYSLGAILYQVLTTRRPFQAETPMATIAQLQMQEPVRPSVLDKRVPRDLECICLKCLEKNPERRYASAQALAEDLEAWLAGEPIRARPPSRRERAWRWIRKHPAAASAVAVSAILCTAGTIAGAIWYRHIQEERRRDQARADGETYVKNVQLAFEKLRENSAERRVAGLEFLKQCPPQLRHWEWHWLARCFIDKPRLLRGNGTPVTFAAWSRDASRLATLANNRVIVWDADLCQPVVELPTTWAEGASPLALNHDGRMLAVTGMRGLSIHRQGSGWTDTTYAATGMPLSDSCSLVAIHPSDDRVAALIGGSVVVLLDGKTLKRQREIRPKSRVTNLCFHPEGSLLLIACTDHLLVVDLPDGDARRVDTPADFATFDAAGRWLMTIGEAKVAYWRADDWTRQGQWNLPESVKPTSVRLSREGSIVSGIANSALIFLDARTGSKLPEPPAVSIQASQVKVLAAVPDSGDRFWAIAETDGNVALIAGSPDREASGERTVPGRGPVSRVALSPDGAWCLETSGSGTEAKSTLRSLTEGEFALPPATGSWCWSGDGCRCAAPENRTVHLLQAENRQIVSRFNTPCVVHAVGLSFHGDKVAYATEDAKVRIHAIHEGKETLLGPGHSKPPTYLVFSPNGRILATGGQESVVLLWDAETGQRLGALRTDDGAVSRLVFSPDSKTLATTGRSADVRLWSMASREMSLVLPTHGTNSVSALTFSSDGARLACAASVGIEIWETATGRKLITLASPGQPLDLCFAKNRLLAAFPDGSVTIWNGEAKRQRDH